MLASVNKATLRRHGVTIIINATLRLGEVTDGTQILPYFTSNAPATQLALSFPKYCSSPCQDTPYQSSQCSCCNVSPKKQLIASIPTKLKKINYNNEGAYSNSLELNSTKHDHHTVKMAKVKENDTVWNYALFMPRKPSKSQPNDLKS